MVNEPSPPSTRFLEGCPACGYSLAGSPDEGLCPECGIQYDQRVLIFNGGETGSRATFASASPRALPWIVLGVLFQAVFLWLPVLSDHGRPLRLGIIGGLFVCLILQIAQRFTASRPGLVQVFLAPEGFLQLEPGRGSLLKRLEIGTLWVTIAVVIVSVVAESDPGGRGAIIGLLVAFGATLVIGPLLYLYWLGQSRPWNALGSLTPQQLIAKYGLRWSEADEVKVKPGRPGHVCVRVKTSYGGRRNVDAEVAVSDEWAGRLKDLLSNWRADDRRRAITSQFGEGAVVVDTANHSPT